MKTKTLILLSLSVVMALANDLDVKLKKTSVWDSGYCEKVVVINNSDKDIDWDVSFKIEGDIDNIWNVKYSVDDNSTLHAEGVDWNNIVKAHNQVEFGFCAKTASTNNTNSNSSSNNNQNSQANSNQNFSTDLTKFCVDYKEVLPLAIKFYEAQRAAGPFEKVTWRKPAALDDGKDVGKDLSKGWFDAGDHVKFNLPMSYSATMLNWGIILFKDAYLEIGELDYAKDQVKYALDYFLEAYDEGEKVDDPVDDKVYYQVGDPHKDHAFWGPPEDMTMPRPTYTCDATHKCTEVSAGMAAALASGAIVFSDEKDYANKLLQKAKLIYKFAETYQGNNGYTAAQGFYTSFSGYNDELAWGAIWLYLATKDKTYLQKAEKYIKDVQSAIQWSQSWDNVSIGAYLLLAQVTQKDEYKKAIKDHLDFWLYKIKRSPGGLAFLNNWGSLRYSSTASFIALAYAKLFPDDPQDPDYIKFAQGQINYILGNNPRHSSYVVGFGNNPPINPHHRASHNSKVHNIDIPKNNEYILEGALVGGPKSADDFDYKDDRKDYVANEVATDYNAGFTDALAGLIDLKVTSTCENNETNGSVEVDNNQTAITIGDNFSSDANSTNDSNSSYQTTQIPDIAVIDNNQTQNIEQNSTINNSFSFRIYKGWNLVSADISADELKNNNIEIVWKYANNQWFAYSNDEQIQTLIQKANIPTANEFQAQEGIFIKSKGDFNISIQTDPISYNIKQGWNLFGTNKDISIELFKKDCVDLAWKYKANSAWPWELAIINKNIFSVFPYRFTDIKKGEGFWIRANQDCK